MVIIGRDQAIYRLHHDFVENGRPIWHYNQTAAAYDGAFDRALTHPGAKGTYLADHTWPARSAYPDTLIIGDPHLNFYEGIVGTHRVVVARASRKRRFGTGLKQKGPTGGRAAVEASL